MTSFTTSKNTQLKIESNLLNLPLISNLPFWPSPNGYRDISLGLERVKELLKRVGNPEKKISNVVHLAGTNGKGSTLSFVKNILITHGFSVNCYISPHLVYFNERIIVNNNMVPTSALNNALELCKLASELEPKLSISFFEGITVAALLLFAENPSDFLLLETGMGGRLDATNVFEKILCAVITPISLDHQEYLGNNLLDIAKEKLAIIKSGCATVISKQNQEVIELFYKQYADLSSNNLIFDKDFSIKKNDNGFEYCDTETHNNLTSARKVKIVNVNMLGEHQAENIATAIATAKVVFSQLSIVPDGNKISEAIAKTKWPARLQKISSKKIAENFDESVVNATEFIVDGSHNPAGAETLMRFIENYRQKHRQAKIVMLYASLQDKNYRYFIEINAPLVDYFIACNIENEPKSCKAEDLANLAQNYCFSLSSTTLQQGVEFASSYLVKNLDHSNNLVIFTGSLYFAGEVLTFFEVNCS